MNWHQLRRIFSKSFKTQICFSILFSVLSALAATDFKEIGDEELVEIISGQSSETASEAEEENAKPTEEEEILKQQTARRESLRKCGQKYDYSMKKKTLDLRLGQANQRKKRTYENTEYLVRKEEALAKARRADVDKEVSELEKELAGLEDSCAGPLNADAKADAKTASPKKGP